MRRPAVGERVSDLGGTREGTLVEIEGDTGYVMQPNGVEVEFPLDRLKPYEAPVPETVRTLSGPLRDRALSPAQRTLLAAVPPEIRDAVARSYDAGEGSRTRPPFAQLPDDKQLETIRIYLPTLAPRILAPHMKLVVAFRDLAKAAR